MTDDVKYFLAGVAGIVIAVVGGAIGLPFWLIVFYAFLVGCAIGAS